MNVYRPDTPRAAFALAAAAMAAITMALMVVLPAELEDAGGAEYTLAQKASAPVQAAAVHRGLDLDAALACEERGMIVRLADEMQLTCINAERPVSTASLHNPS